MSSSVALWAVLAVALFWSVGAYNRLVRLRSQAIGAFGALDGQFRRYIALVQTSFPVLAAGHVTAARAGLGGAMSQFESSLKVACERPLDEAAMRALETAHETLCMSWSRVQNEPPDLAGAPLPDTLQLQWEHISQQAGNAREEFDRRVVAYNEAIAQFPARLLAWLFGFRRAKSI